MFYLEAENQLAVINTVLFDLILAKMPETISSFKDLPDTVFITVKKETGEYVILPVWRTLKRYRGNADLNVVTDNALTQLIASFDTPQMIEAYGHLMIVDGPARERARNQIKVLHDYGTNVLFAARKSFAEERAAYNRIQSAQVLEQVREGGWLAVRERSGEEEVAVYGPKLTLKAKNTVIQLGQNFGTDSAAYPSDGTLNFFGVKTNVMLYNPFVKLPLLIQDNAIVVEELKRMFSKEFPFLRFDEVFSDIQIELTQKVGGGRAPLFNNYTSIANKIDNALKVAAEKK